MARLKLVLALFSLMILTAGVAGAAYYWQKYVKPHKQVEMQIAGKNTEEKPDLGKKHYDKAIDYVKEGELISAANELQYMLDIYPESPTIEEAKRVLGELNLDLMLSKVPMEGKTEYKVKSGDALLTIARNSKSTIDYIMRANGKTTSLIYPKENLTVLDLGCTVEIDLEESTLTIKKGEKFVKEYEVLDRYLPNSFPNEASSTISEKVAWYNGGAVKFSNPDYLRSKKWIRTSKMGLFIRQMPEEKPDEDAQKDFGVMVARADMEELFTVLRGGTTVKVTNSGK